MITKDALRNIISSQKELTSLREEYINREKLNEIQVEIPFAIVISGIRRCGKSTLLKQLMTEIKKFYYFNFEDPRAVNFEITDFQKLEEVFKEEIGKSNYYFFDEIQNLEKWEVYVRYLLDRKKYVIITGSNASLLSKELGTKLTGRNLKYELFPFSFKEFLKLTKKNAEIGAFEQYLTKGGFPEYLQIGKESILQDLFSDIINRDIITRHKIRNVKIAKNLALYLITNIGKEFSYNNLKKMFELGSTNSVISLVSYFEDSYLLFTIPKFNYSLRKQIVNPKKVYSIDNGLVRASSASFSMDKGKLLENIVFLRLRSKYKEIFYYQDKNECDFVVKEREKIITAVQVCFDFNQDNQKREIRGLLEALEEFRLKEGLILTYNQEDKFDINGKEIIVKPVWKWLLEK